MSEEVTLDDQRVSVDAYREMWIVDLAFEEIKNYAEQTPSYDASCDLDFYIRLVVTLWLNLGVAISNMNVNHALTSKITGESVDEFTEKIEQTKCD